jgi:hypothetical protein
MKNRRQSLVQAVGSGVLRINQHAGVALKLSFAETLRFATNQINEI